MPLSFSLSLSARRRAPPSISLAELAYIEGHCSLTSWENQRNGKYLQVKGEGFKIKNAMQCQRQNVFPEAAWYLVKNNGTNMDCSTPVVTGDFVSLLSVQLSTYMSFDPPKTYDLTAAGNQITGRSCGSLGGYQSTFQIQCDGCQSCSNCDDVQLHGFPPCNQNGYLYCNAVQAEIRYSGTTMFSETDAWWSVHGTTPPTTDQQHNDNQHLNGDHQPNDAQQHNDKVTVTTDG